MANTSAAVDGLKTLLASHSCLILDPSKVSAANLRGALRQFGMAPGKIFTVGSIAEAEVFLNVNRPTLLIVDFNQDSRDTYRLVEIFEKLHPESARIALLAIAGGGAVVNSDGQVDGHVLKPFKLDILRRTLLKSLVNKQYPDAYRAKIIRADELAESGQDDAARIHYEEAKLLNPKPLRAHRGLALLHRRHGRLEQSRDEYQRARACAGDDYKSVLGEFEVLLGLGDLSSACGLIPLLRDSLPIDSDRLTKLFETVTRAGRFDELGPLLRVFRDLPERTDELILTVRESFFAAGQDAMKTAGGAKALEFFEIGFQVAARRFDYVEKVVTEFLQTGLREEAELFLAKSLPEDVGSAAYRRVCFELDCLILPMDLLIERGRKLIFDDHGTPQIYSKMVSLLAEVGKVTMAEAIIAKATESDPSLRGSLYELLHSGSAEEDFRKAA